MVWHRVSWSDPRRQQLRAPDAVTVASAKYRTEDIGRDISRGTTSLLVHQRRNASLLCPYIAGLQSKPDLLEDRY